MKKIVLGVTGVNGFIGATLIKFLLEHFSNRYELVALIREKSVIPSLDGIAVHRLGPDLSTSRFPILDVLIHVGGGAHISERYDGELEEHFMNSNYKFTNELGLLAAKSGVNKMIYISTAKVYGEVGNFSEKSEPLPTSSYAKSKFAAELSLAKIGSCTGMRVLILRPPLVYGGGVKGNFLKLLKLVDSGLPVPLGAIDNLRSMIYVENLCQAIEALVAAEDLKESIYDIDDGAPVSTSYLVSKIYEALHKRPLIMPYPSKFFSILNVIMGREVINSALIHSFVTESKRFRMALSWQPNYSFDQGLRKTVEWFKSNGH